MRVLVCGGAGYIGSNMTAMLAGEGYEPTVIDNLSTGHISSVLGVEFVQGDLGNCELLAETLRERNIEAVMHFAASIEVGESVHSPLKYYRNNLCNTYTLLSAMETVGVEKLVLSSTAAVYGMPLEVPVKEDSPTQPINPYGQTKLAAERMCHYQSQTGRLRYAALRYFNACGAGNNSTLGEDHRPESHLIPLAIQAAIGKRGQLDIYGTDYPTPDGTCLRDYIHVEDLCQAHLLALDRLQADSELVYNLGNNKGYSVREVVETVKRASGRDFKVVEADRRAGDAPVLTCDHTRAKEQLGWEPEHPELEQIVATAWKWHSEHPDGYPD
ncbi:MAG: UDP-glucose 4-epimerase GalE [Planctomycetota bacterium]|jgi:UDP-glucose 4-epimerase